MVISFVNAALKFFVFSSRLFLFLFFTDSVLPPCKVRVKQKVECHGAI